MLRKRASIILRLADVPHRELCRLHMPLTCGPPLDHLQAFHVCTSHVVQAAWDRGQELAVYGVVYNLQVCGRA